MVYGNLTDTVCQIQNDEPNFTLSWSHYLVLMRIENPDERHFYEIECQQQNWSVRQLQRQYASSLYERLALSRNKGEVMRLANEGQTMEKPSDVIKSPVTLEFYWLYLKSSANLVANSSPRIFSAMHLPVAPSTKKMAGMNCTL